MIRFTNPKTHLISIDENGFCSSRVFEARGVLLRGNGQAILLPRGTVFGLKFDRISRSNQLLHENLPEQTKRVKQVAENQTKLRGSGRSATAWERVTMAACCCSVKGAFCGANKQFPWEHQKKKKKRKICAQIWCQSDLSLADTTNNNQILHENRD